MTDDQWVAKAFEAHSLISVKIGSEISEINLGDAKSNKKILKEALALIDQLDYLLESFPEEKTTYQKTYHALFALLEKLGLRPWAVDTLREQFGANSFFVLAAQPPTL
ncbi:MAG: hypothetical protein KBD23_00550 [Gammaproteobacteria bacterium]|nr:hypothetical protein [Gammaproteobacteria bacterium]